MEMVIIIAGLTERQKADFNWFKEHRNDLYQQYGNCIIVISNKNVLGTYDIKYEAVTETVKNQEMGTFIVQKLSDSDQCYRGVVGGAYYD